MRLQLTARSLTLVGIVLTLALAAPARADDSDVEAETNNDHASADQADHPESDAPKKKEVTPPEERTPDLVDRTVKRASIEMATYNDTDHVTVFTPTIAGTIENPAQGASLSGRYIVDVVSAASVDIVSTASRRWEEVRHAGSVEGHYKPHDFGASLAGNVSSEPDYLSYGVAGSITHDFDEKNLSLLFGYGYSHDTIGRGGTSFTVFSRTLQRSSFNGGLTRVVSRSTIVGVSLDAMFETGDQSKPYRYVPMFAPDVASKVPVGASIAYVTSHRLPERPLEQLPLSRRRFALAGRVAHRFSTSTLRLDERLYDDTWDLKASTTDARWIFDVGKRFALWPHGRFHVQGPAGFWQRAYTSGPAPGWSLPEFRTGDRELGPLWTATGGAGIQIFLGPSEDPRSWTLGATFDVAHTEYQDDLYLTGRTSELGALTLETSL